MPSTYAHQRFGDLVFEKLSTKTRQYLSQYTELYNIGLQGPDIFFYYDPVHWGNPVIQIGENKHLMTGRAYFSQALERLGESASITYLCGVLCHYALDSACHAYINEYAAGNDVTHAEIEGELDRALIAAEGRNPVKEVMTAKFIPSEESAAVIARFYPETDAKTVYKALKGFTGLHSLLRCPGDLKRNTIYGILRLIGKYDSFHGHITNKYPDPRCDVSNAVLPQMLEDTVPAAVSLIESLLEALAGTTGLHEVMAGGSANIGMEVAPDTADVFEDAKRWRGGIDSWLTSPLLDRDFNGCTA